MIVLPHQEVYNLVYDSLAEVYGEGKIYDFHDAKAKDYPICFIADLDQVTGPDNKSRVFPVISLSVHVYDYKTRGRGSFTRDLVKVLDRITKTEKTDYYPVQVRDTQLRVLRDNSTEIDLLHGVLDFRVQAL